ncbi:MAG: hypothetical protein H8E69_01070 [Actinobacteria bacterium]|nr:hypothetical protein [Actinomycetota bacterium]
MISSLDNQVLAKVAAATGGRPRQPDRRRKTFLTVTQRRFHLRTYDGNSPDWFFGINERFWNPTEYFVLTCGGRQPRSFVIPVMDLNIYSFPLNGEDRKLHVIYENCRWFLRDPSPRMAIDEHTDAFELLK